jgi:DNA-binding CsgD family transcriptional regulator/tetratricopeptide (TPR) repeat protein
MHYLTHSPISSLLVSLPVSFIITFLCLTQMSAAQHGALNPRQWAAELGKKHSFDEENWMGVSSPLWKLDSLQAFQFLEQLAQKGDLEEYHFGARFHCLKATVLSNKIRESRFYPSKKAEEKDRIKAQITDLHTRALEMAYRSEDDGLIACVSYAYARTTASFNETGISVMYLKNAIDLCEKNQQPVRPAHYQELALQLYRIQEYEQSIHYADKAIAGWAQSADPLKNNETLTCINTKALGYHRQQKYDSAMLFYNQALQVARRLNHTVWVGIVSGNMGQIFYAQGQYDTAYTLLKQDYQWSKNAGGYGDAANSLQWAARTNLAMGNKTQALSEVREAIRLLKMGPEPVYLKNASYTATQIFRELGLYDSAFYYNSLYNKVNDSLEKMVATSSLAISKARLNDERSRYQIHNLNRDKQSEVLYRNILVAAIVALSLFALLLVNRRRLLEKLKSEKAEQEMVQEVTLAREQLRLFTENIVEKTALIEKLEEQASKKEASAEQQGIIAELSRQTILTEADWDKFKALFETIYPGFFIKLKQNFANISVAEQRMAALIRLSLTSKEMASMLGISVDSVHKTRQRLRQRLQLTSDSSLKEMVSAI